MACWRWISRQRQLAWRSFIATNRCIWITALRNCLKSSEGFLSHANEATETEGACVKRTHTAANGRAKRGISDFVRDRVVCLHQFLTLEQLAVVPHGFLQLLTTLH